MFERPRSGERAVLVRLGLGTPVDPEDLPGIHAAGALRRARSRWPPSPAGASGPIPRYFMGSGKARRSRRMVAQAENADVILVDHALIAQPGAQSREAHRAARARSQRPDPRHFRAARAQLRRQARSGARAAEAHRQRLVRGWTHLERQRGGGIGLRGPGETQLETDRRLVGQRMKVLTQAAGEDKTAARDGPSAARRNSGAVRDAGRLHQRRQIDPVSRAHGRRCLRGRPALRDARSRRYGASTLPGGTPMVVADTVGFIRELPHELVAAFQSTLTEAREATLLLHVVDASDPRRDEHIAQVRRCARRDRSGHDSPDSRLQQGGSPGVPAADRPRPRRPGGRSVDFGGEAPGIDLLARQLPSA